MAGLFSSFSSFSTICTSESSSTGKFADVSAFLLTSESTYGSGRFMAKAAVDWAAFCKLQVLPKDVPGKKYMTLQGDLGYDEYKALCKDDAGLVLLQINYCQESLSATNSLKNLSEGSKTKNMSSLINHDYLILEIQSNLSTLPKIYIKAEKASAPEPGIHIRAIPAKEISQVLHHGVKLFTVDCNYSKIRMEDLEDALLKETADYSLRNANCWDYALATTKSVLKRCAEVPGLSANEKNRLLTEHDSVGSNLANRHIRNTVKNLIEGFGNLISSSTAGTAAILQSN